MKRIPAILSAMLLVLSWAAQAQTRDEIRARMDSITSPQLVGEDRLRFDQTRMDLGQVKDNAGNISRTFHFKNTGRKKAAILAIHTSCSCLEASFDRKVLAPGEEGMIVLNFNPKNFSGDVEVKAMVYTDFSGKHPSNLLSMKADVQLSDKWRHLPYAIGDLRLKRKKLSISEVLETNHRSERIPCANTGKKPMKLSAMMLPSYARLRTEPEIIPPDSEADIWIEIDGKKISQMRDRSKPVHFNIMLKGTGGSQASRMIEVVVQPMLNREKQN